MDINIMQDYNTGQKVRRNKLVVIVIDGWVNSIHQLFLRRKINKEIDFKAKRLIFTLLLLIHSKLNLGFVGTTLTSTTRRLVASWSGSRSSWTPGFALSTSSPSSQQSHSQHGRQFKLVCFALRKPPLVFALQASTRRAMELLGTNFTTERWLFLHMIILNHQYLFSYLGAWDDADEKWEKLLRILQHWGRTDDGQSEVVAKGPQLIFWKY